MKACLVGLLIVGFFGSSYGYHSDDPICVNVNNPESEDCEVLESNDQSGVAFKICKDYSLMNGFAMNFAFGCADSFSRETANAITGTMLTLLGQAGCTVKGSYSYSVNAFGPDIFHMDIEGSCPQGVTGNLYKKDYDPSDTKCVFWSTITVNGTTTTYNFDY